MRKVKKVKATKKVFVNDDQLGFQKRIDPDKLSFSMSEDEEGTEKVDLNELEKEYVQNMEEKPVKEETDKLVFFRR